VVDLDRELVPLDQLTHGGWAPPRAHPAQGSQPAPRESRGRPRFPSRPRPPWSTWPTHSPPARALARVGPAPGNSGSRWCRSSARGSGLAWPLSHTRSRPGGVSR